MYEKIEDVDYPENMFLISRTSDRSINSPHDRAQLCDFLFVQMWDISLPSHLLSKGGEIDWWYAGGTNHRIIDGCLARDMHVAQRWVIDVPDLIAFYDEVGELIISKFFGLYHIEIYDDYRE